MPGVGSLSQLDQPTANELLVRGALWRGADGHLDDFDNLRLGNRPIVPIVLARIDSAAAIARQATSCGQALTEATAFIDKALRHEIQVGAGLRADETAVLDALCNACSAAQVADPFEALFETIAPCAAGLYDTDWPPVALSTRRFASAGGAYGVSAFTLPASAANGPVEVVLRIDPDAFGPKSYAAIPALLIHECVCHVATWMPVPPPSPDNGSPFAEGFMDFAADYYRALWSSELGALAPIVEQHGQQLFAEIEQRGGPLSVGRRRGRHAAQVMKHQLVAQVGSTPAEASRLVARLAVELNVVPRPLAIKDRFVEHLPRSHHVALGGAVLLALKDLTPAADLL